MRIIKQNIYNFDELSKDIQEKLIEKEKENQKELFLECFLLDEMQEKAKELLQKYFKNNAEFKNVYYSLSYCQGDGAMIGFDLKYYNKTLTIKHQGYYCHERSFRICENDFALSEKQEKKLKEKIIKINKELCEFGYNLIEYDISDEKVKELLQENEYFSNGEIYIIK